MFKSIINFFHNQMQIHDICMENMWLEFDWLAEYQRRKKKGTEVGFVTLKEYKQTRQFNKE